MNSVTPAWCRLVQSTVKFVGVVGVLCLMAGTIGCATQTPTIAHVHVGHAITGANDTEEKLGYFVLAERRARAAALAATAAVRDNRPLDEAKENIAAVNQQTNTRDDYALAQAVTEAANHITFAALSPDASDNVRHASAAFEKNIAGVMYRSNLIKLYASDAAASRSATEVAELAQEIHKLTLANVNGEDIDGDGRFDSSAREFGIVQLRRDLDALVDREDPPYTTVERWYLFNLIRLPSGDWIFRRSGGGNSRGY